MRVKWNSCSDGNLVYFHWNLYSVYWSNEFRASSRFYCCCGNFSDFILSTSNYKFLRCWMNELEKWDYWPSFVGMFLKLFAINCNFSSGIRKKSYCAADKKAHGDRSVREDSCRNSRNCFRSTRKEKPEFS